MVNIFLNAGISALFAGLTAIGVAALIEKFGGLIGGVLGSTPTTIIPAMVGIYIEYEANQEKYTNSAFSVPIGTFTNSLFLFTWGFLPKYLPIKNTNKKLILMLFISLSVWFAVAVSVMALRQFVTEKYDFDHRYFGTIFLCLHFVFAMATTFFQKTIKPKGKNKTSWYMILIRGIGAGAIIFLSIVLSKYAGPSVAGVSSIFPVVFLTTIMTVWISQGESVALGAVGPLMLGMVSVPTYSIVSSFLVFIIGIAWGSLATYVICISYSTLAVLFLRIRQKSIDRQYTILINQPSLSGSELLGNKELDNKEPIEEMESIQYLDGNRLLSEHSTK